MGWPALGKGVVILRLAKNRFEIGDRVPPEAAGWARFPVKADRPTLTLEVPGDQGAPTYVNIDTGDDAGVKLAPEIWRRWKARHAGGPFTLEAGYMPGSGVYVDEVGWDEAWSMGGVPSRGVPISEENVAETKVGPKGATATLGLIALRRIDLVIDKTHGVAYARSVAMRPKPFPHNRLGAVFVPRSIEKDDLVALVADGSPAALAGIRDGDLLVKINRLDVTKWRTQPGILPLSRFFEQPPGTKLVLTLLRGGRTFRVTAVLQDIMGPPANAR